MGLAVQTSGSLYYVFGYNQQLFKKYYYIIKNYTAAVVWFAHTPL